MQRNDMFVEERTLYTCPNPACGATFLRYRIFEGLMPESSRSIVDVRRGKCLTSFTVLPSTPKPLSKHVPDGVAEDYAEAYAIRELSPKASVTLARRALQGMVRNFWNVSDRTLHGELQAIEDRCDPDIYQAVMGLKSVGNIGAHPERDINLIVEVDSGEADELLALLRQLDQEWYVAREARKARLAKIAALKSKAADAAQKVTTTAEDNQVGAGQEAG